MADRERVCSTPRVSGKATTPADTPAVLNFECLAMLQASQNCAKVRLAR